MKYTGVLIKESLLDEAFLNFVTVTKSEPRQLEASTPEQLASVTFVHFTVGDDLATAVVEEISKSLKARGWYATVESEYERFVIFPHKIFKYSLTDGAARQKAFDYGKSLGIPEIQLEKL